MNFYEPTDDQRAMWDAWVAERPDAVRTVAERVKPWALYRMRSTGQRVTLCSLGEHDDGSVTVTVDVSGEFNLIVFGRRVFGISPDDLEECDIPATTEPLGAVLTNDTEVKAYLNAMRPDPREAN